LQYEYQTIAVTGESTSCDSQEFSILWVIFITNVHTVVY